MSGWSRELTIATPKGGDEAAGEVVTEEPNGHDVGRIALSDVSTTREIVGGQLDAPLGRNRLRFVDECKPLVDPRVRELGDLVQALFAVRASGVVKQIAVSDSA